MTRSLAESAEVLLDRIRQVPGRFWRRACIVVLSLWLCYSLAQLFWLLMPAPDLPEPSLQMAQNAVFTDQTTGNATNVDINELKQYALFGNSLAPVEVQPVSEAPPGIEDGAQETRLNLVLRGTMPSSDETASAAIIADGPKQEIYLIGQELEISARGVKLAKVLPDRVVLNNNGTYETLSLYEEQERRARSPRTVNRTNTLPGRRPIAPVRTPQQDSATAADANEFIDAVRPQDGQELPNAQQIKTVTDVFNVSMYREGGQFIGYRIRPKGNRELFDQLGLQANDVVTAVNNVGLTDTNKAMEVYRSLAQESQATLEILRDGVTVTVDVTLDQ